MDQVVNNHWWLSSHFRYTIVEFELDNAATKDCYLVHTKNCGLYNSLPLWLYVVPNVSSQDSMFTLTCDFIMYSI